MKGIYEHHMYQVPTVPFKYNPRSPKSKMDFSVYHWHEQLEILYFHNNAAKVRCSGITYSPRAGDLILINPYELHDISDQLGMSHDCLIIDVSFLTENGIMPDHLRLSTMVRDREAARLTDKILQSYQDESHLMVPRIRSSTLNLILYLYDRYVSAEIADVSDSTAQYIMKAIRYVRTHYAEQITLNDAAAAAGFSRYYFSHKFQEIVGQSFVPYLNAVRCEKATTMLLGGMSVTEVCYACGFRDVSQFSRTYHKIVGEKPSSLKKNTAARK